MLTCPECQTVQTTTSPFCENCGYRLRSQATMVEGMAAITPEMLKGPERPSLVSTAEHMQLGQERTDPEDDALVGALPPRPKRQAQTHPAVFVAPEESPAQDDTKSRRRRPLPTTEERALVPAASSVSSSSSSLLAKPSELSGLYEAPDGSALIQAGAIPAPAGGVSATGLGLFLGGWALITAMGVLGAYFVITHDPHKPAAVSLGAQEAMTRVEIPAGTFLRGLDESTRAYILRACRRVADIPDDDCEQDVLLAGEYPQASVELPTFYMDAREVTVAEYLGCVGAGKCEAIDYKGCKVYTPQGLQIALRVPKHLEQPEQPVTCVNRAQAQSYCAFAGGKLPSHDQWEKAARGVDGSLFAWGTTWDPLVANWGEVDVVKTSISGKVDGFAWTAPPGRFSKGKSPYGLWDVAGNVAEWVEGQELAGHARGGSWTSDPFALRTTVRQPVKSIDKRTDVGFRCVYDAAQ